MKKQISAFYYCAGVSDADDEYDDFEVDAERLADKVAEGADLHATVVKAVDAVLAIDPFLPDRGWFDEEYEEDLGDHELTMAGLDEAYKHWCRGRRDQFISLLHGDVVDGIIDLVEDDEDDEDAEENPSGPLTYGHFSRTGTQDCGNVWSIDDVGTDAIHSLAKRIRNKTLKGAALETEADQIAEAAFARDEDMDSWIKQQDDFEGLDPKKAYAAWRGAWVACSASELIDSAQKLAKRADEDEDDE